MNHWGLILSPCLLYAVLNYVSNGLSLPLLLFLSYIPTYFLTFYYSKYGGMPWPKFQRLDIWKVISRYHSASISLEDNLDHQQQYIFCIFPHGTCTISHLVTMTDALKMFSEHYRGPRRDLAASVLFAIPFVKEILLFLGCVDAGATTALFNLQKGRSLLIYVGGEKEQLATKPYEQKIYVKNRKGFVKLALEFGTPLVPMYAFGENECYTVSNIAFGFRSWLQNKFQIAIPVFWGRYGTLVPYSVPIHIEIGKPMQVPKTPKALISPELLDKTHRLFMDEIERLFNRTKGKYGPAYANAKLELH